MPVAVLETQHGVAPTNIPSQATEADASTTSTTHININQQDDPTMVAGFFSSAASGSPPESPHRNNAGHNSFSVSTPGQSFLSKSPGGDKKSPKASRRATCNADGLSSSPHRSPHRLMANNNNNNSSAANSPVPPSGRLQPATATAPVVGRHHKKTNSLVGFDPLLDVGAMDMNINGVMSPLNPASYGTGNTKHNGIGHVNNNNKEVMPLQQQAPMTPKRSTNVAVAAATVPAVSSSLSNMTLSSSASSSPKKNQDTTTCTTTATTAEQGLNAMSAELRKLAKDVSAASPQHPASSTSKLPKPKFGRGASLTPLFNLTPPFRSDKNAMASSSSSHTTTKEPLTAPYRKLPWQRHRRSRSLETPEDVLNAVGRGAANPAASAATDLTVRLGSFENDSKTANTTVNNNNNNNNTPTKRASTTLVPSSSMMEDFYDVVKEQAKQDAAGSIALSLAMPSLAKPAPTSFLTGKEIVRSSEQDPSPFQMEIPTLDQTLVAARLVQFVDQYRKEDMNLDLNMSFVGLNRMKMQNFVLSADNNNNNNKNKGGANSAHQATTPANLTEAHRPVVESLLEAADDVTVAGFVATENAGSADARREAVILERQMQFVVVFRGTTPEQGGKTAFFKKNNKQNVLEPLESDVANADCKVYATVKQAYIELEKRVFDCLDNLMDQNPFCDVVFTGHSLGGAMATLAAFRYATNRPMVRVSGQTFGSPKVGNRVFRQQANSLPNLKVMRIEYANDSKCFAPPGDTNAAHLGHSIVLSKNTDNNSALTAMAFKFDDHHDLRKHHLSKPNIILAAFKKERDITSYASALEQMYQAKHRWVSDFKGEDGTGVRGKDNEQRQVV